LVASRLAIRASATFRQNFWSSASAVTVTSQLVTLSAVAALPADAARPSVLSRTSTIGTFLPNAALAASLIERLVLPPGFTTANSSISLRRLLAILTPAPGFGAGRRPATSDPKMTSPLPADKVVPARLAVDPSHLVEDAVGDSAEGDSAEALQRLFS
jgi:hypothetical protein